MEEKSIFREENLKKAVDPEQLNACLKVTGVAPWMVLLAAGLVLAAVFVWFFFGKLKNVAEGAGYCRDGVITCYFRQKEIGEFTVGDPVDVEGTEGTVTEIDTGLIRKNDLPNEVMFLVPDSEWYSTVLISCGVADGLYSVRYHEADTAPASFLT